MRIWTGKERPEKDIPFPDQGRRKWRRTLDISWGCIEFGEDFASEKSPEWYPLHQDYYCVSVGGRWGFGDEHVYYDGPHCIWSLGPLHFCWGGNWKCRKCCPPPRSLP